MRNAPPGGKAYAAPDFPSFQATSGQGGQRGASNGHASAGYDGYRDAGYGTGRDGYQGSGYGRDGSSGNGGSRRDAAGYDGAYGSGDSAASGYGRSGNGSGGRGNDSGYGGGPGYGSANGRSGSAGYAPEFTSVDNDDAEDDGPVGTPRPYGRLSIYTLHDDKTREFDRLAERAAEGVRTAEPDTLVYVIHVVPKAPMQRIIYEIYRDRAAFLSHERQPHIRQFAADRASCVLATNIIDLRLKYAKVASLGSPPESSVQGHAQPSGELEPARRRSRPRQRPVLGGASVRAAPVLIGPVRAGPVLVSTAAVTGPVLVGTAAVTGPVLVGAAAGLSDGGELHAGEGPATARTTTSTRRSGAKRTRRLTVRKLR